MQIVANELTKYFDDFLAVNSVSFEVAEGEIFGLLGPNGAGKTTILRMFAGILEPSEGEVWINNFPMKTQKVEARKNLGFHTGDTGLYERLTAKEMLEYFGRLSQVPENILQERVAKLIFDFQITSFQSKFCGKLSTGQKQRVAIARTLVHDPKLIILDEPTTGLDIVASEFILNFIKESKENGKSIIFSTHNLSEVERLCDRIGIIHKGEMKIQGTLAEILEQTETQKLSDAFLSLVSEDFYAV
ncbi:ATP-binding cassette domain-containing protein [bacterium]|nr:ATP-binding cassette domain-containing protein [bacterium]